MLKQLLLVFLLLTATLLADDPRLKHYANATEWLKDADTNADSAFNLGVIYHKNIKDYEKAIYWYKQAYQLDKGSDVVSNLGFIYDDLKEYKEAIKWYKIGIVQGDATSAFNLALLYKQRLKDYPNAITYYEKAISLGDKGAAFNLGLLYENNLKDYPNAIKYYEKSYEMGEIGGANGLGYLYEFSLNDTKKAELWYKTAIKKNNQKAFGNLAKLYHKQNKDELGAAYLLALVNNGYSKEKVFSYLKDKWHLTDEEIEKAYKLQKTLDIPKHYTGGID